MRPSIEIAQELDACIKRVENGTVFLQLDQAVALRNALYGKIGYNQTWTRLVFVHRDSVNQPQYFNFRECGGITTNPLEGTWTDNFHAGLMTTMDLMEKELKKEGNPKIFNLERLSIVVEPFHEHALKRMMEVAEDDTRKKALAKLTDAEKKALGL